MDATHTRAATPRFPGSSEDGTIAFMADLPAALPRQTLDAIVADLAEALGRPAEGIVVAAVEAHRWPNGALGCPEPGAYYAQVVSDGFRVLLTADDRRYDYRVTRSGSFRRCLHATQGPPGDDVATGDGATR